MNLRLSTAVLFAIAAGALVAADCGAAGDAALGQRIYREGILSSGQPLTTVSTLQGVTLSGEKAACITCHRRSGFGGSEGQYTIRPITQRYLFHDASELYPSKYRGVLPTSTQRPAYSNATLARAIRLGVDTGGHPLGGIMPRYGLDDTDIEHLAAYLKTLSAAPDPGVTDTTVHFATVVDATADPGQRQAMLEILEAYFRDKNGGSRSESERARRAPWDHAREYRAYRKWELHVWTLQGPPETWGAQLRDYYAKQPVFAVLSGVGVGNWQPVHDFCERSELPCLFPNVDQPPQTQGQYSLYFSRGLPLEAEALATHLARSGAKGSIVQVYNDETADAARAFRSAIAAAGLPLPADRVIKNGASADTDFWRELGAAKPGVLVLWLKSDELSGLAALGQFPGQLYLSSRLAGLPKLPDELAARTAMLYPWELPQRVAPRMQRLSFWLRLKKIVPREDVIQANTFFAVSQAGDAMMHLLDDFSRDYFIERIEHGLENSQAPSVYPRPSLGPGQRYVSKGSYVVKAAAADRHHLEAVGDWVVPDLPPAAMRK